VKRDASIDSAIAELDNDISQPDSPIQLPLSPVKCGETCTASPMDKDISDGVGPLLDSPLHQLSAPATCVTSPVIDGPPQPFPPLSKSVIKAAIKKVAEAGYLKISEPTDSPNQVLQHLKTVSQSGKAETSNSNSRKRSREEQGSPNEDKKAKKQAVPTREQSSRCDTFSVFISFADISLIASRTPTIGTSMLPSAPVRLRVCIELVTNRGCWNFTRPALGRFLYPDYSYALLAYFSVYLFIYTFT
jgi:hypothetical protein